MPMLKRCRNASRKHILKPQHQSNNEANRQKRNYDKFTSTVQLMLGDVVLTKADACFKEKGR